MPVPSQISERSCSCVFCGIDCASFYDFSICSWNCPDSAVLIAIYFLLLFPRSNSKILNVITVTLTTIGIFNDIYCFFNHFLGAIAGGIVGFLVAVSLTVVSLMICRRR